MSQTINSSFFPNYTSDPCSPELKDCSASTEDPANKKREIDPHFAIETIAAQFHIQPAQLFQPQDMSVALPRAISVYILKTYLHLSSLEIESFLGVNDTEIARTITLIQKKIEGKNLAIIGSLNQWKKSLACLQQPEPSVVTDALQTTQNLDGGHKRKREITVCHAEEPEKKKAKIDPHFVIETIAAQFRIQTAQLFQPQDMSVALPRAISIYILKNHLHFSHLEIENFLGVNDAEITRTITLIQKKIEGKNITIIGSLDQWKSSLAKVNPPQIEPGGQAETAHGLAPKPTLYRNNLKNQFLAASALPQNLDSHSCLTTWQWSFAPNQDSEEPSCQIPNSSGCFGIATAARIQLPNISTKEPTKRNRQTWHQKLKSDMEKAKLPNATPKERERGQQAAALLKKRRESTRNYLQRLKSDVEKAKLPNAALEELDRGQQAATLLKRRNSRSHTMQQWDTAMRNAQLPGATPKDREEGLKAAFQWKEMRARQNAYVRRYQKKLAETISDGARRDATLEAREAGRKSHEIFQKMRQKSSKKTTHQENPPAMNRKKIAEQIIGKSRSLYQSTPQDTSPIEEPSERESQDYADVAAELEMFLQNPSRSSTPDATDFPAPDRSFFHFTEDFEGRKAWPTDIDSFFQKDSPATSSASDDSPPLATSENGAEMDGETLLDIPLDDFENWFPPDSFENWDIPEELFEVYSPSP